jgi:hypothetical protein
MNVSVQNPPSESDLWNTVRRLSERELVASYAAVEADSQTLTENVLAKRVGGVYNRRYVGAVLDPTFSLKGAGLWNVLSPTHSLK